MNMRDVTEALSGHGPLSTGEALRLTTIMLQSTIRALELGDAVEKALKSTLQEMVSAARSLDPDAFTRAMLEGGERIKAAEKARELYAAGELGIDR